MKLAAAALAITMLVQAPTANDLRARLAAYLTDYEPKLSELISDEVMIQQTMRGNRTAGGGIGPPEFRTIRSEVAFIALPGDAGWMGFRRVTKVGSNLVADENWRPHDWIGRRVARRLQARARDVGRKRAVQLGFTTHGQSTEPSVGTAPARHASRFTVRIAGKEHVRGKNTTKLVFVENVAPTIIRALDGSQMRSIVSAFIEPDSGRLWRADVITRDPSQGDFAFDAVISVEFRNDRKLEMLVPAQMHEEFFAGANRRGRGDAVYSNYRRFQTTARIVPQ